MNIIIIINKYRRKLIIEYIRFKVVNNFKYLGAWMSSSSKDFEIRKALAWQACHKLKKLWNSKLKRKLKIRTFQATIESILLYGSET